MKSAGEEGKDEEDEKEELIEWGTCPGRGRHEQILNNIAKNAFGGGGPGGGNFGLVSLHLMLATSYTKRYVHTIPLRAYLIVGSEAKVSCIYKYVHDKYTSLWRFELQK